MRKRVVGATTISLLAAVAGCGAPGGSDAVPTSDGGRYVVPDAADAGIDGDAPSAQVCAPATSDAAAAAAWSPPAAQEPPDPLPVQPHAGEVMCGDQLVCAAGEHCCAQELAIPAGRFSYLDSTYANYLGCDTSPDCARFPLASSVLYCDGPEDCRAGDECCGNVAAAVGSTGSYPTGAFTAFFQGVAPTWCAPSCSCGTAEFCHTDADCPDGTACLDPASYARLDVDATTAMYTEFYVGTGLYLPYRICSVATCLSDETSTRLEDAGAALPEDPARVRVSLGRGHACALARDARLVCWGDNRVGQSSPPSGTFLALDAGGDRTCGIRTSGEVACWGGKTGCASPAPAGEFTDVSVSESHACAVRRDGAVLCWGDDRVAQSSPPPGAYVDVAAALGTSCAIRRDDQVAVCWGLGGSVVLSGAWSSVETTAGFVCLMRSDQTMLCGNVSAPDVESGPVRDVSLYSIAGIVVDAVLDASGMVGGSAVTVSGSGGPGPYRQISAEQGAICAVRVDGGIDCWGTEASIIELPGALR